MEQHGFTATMVEKVNYLYVRVKRVRVKDTLKNNALEFHNSAR